ncbi:hypothetical protein CPT_Shady_026 [Streptomyces phage Shady]|uniref:Uncharacterized protein n=1 Tax=Streptomyces phage Shady TaxID=2767585 RepID=A0A873WE80_9CAUD|nr:hypothetical protein CPT_Shady_026 [Streptomyces phage Shady]
MSYCLNCKNEHPEETTEEHVPPCSRCDSDGHSTCQH